MLKSINKKWIIAVSVFYFAFAGSWMYVARHVITPKSLASGTSTTSMEPVELSVHTYDRDHWLDHWATGESLTFIFPKAYFQNTALFSGGAHRRIHISFDARNLEPSVFHDTGRRRDADGGTGFILNDHRISASVELSALDRDPLFPRDSEDYFGRIADRYTPLGEVYCGLDLLRRRDESDRDWLLEMLVSGEMRLVDIRQTRPFPLNTAQYFIAEDPAGSIRTEIRCDPHAPRCGARTDYRGRWNLRVLFPANRLCEWQAFVDQSREVFDTHLVGATQPRPEYQ